MTEPSWKIVCGDVLSTLRNIAAESIQCCVTSPPYWGLRDYNTEIQIWGEAAGCDHEWGPPVVGRSQSGSLNGSTLQGAKPGLERRPGWSSAYCQYCGAWRGSLGLEPTPELYVEHLVAIFREVWRVLRKDGTCFLNLGDSYYGSWGNYGGQNRGNGTQRPVTSGQQLILKPKDLCGIPWRVAFALQGDGWWLRSDIIWSKPNPMPESVTDRPTKSHEYLFLLTKSATYFYDMEAIKEPCRSGKSDRKKMVESLPRLGGKHKELVDPLSKASAATNIGQKRAVGGYRSGNKERKIDAPGRLNTHMGSSVPWDCPEDFSRNRRSVWFLATQPYSGAHFATFPEALVEPCIKAGTSERGCCSKCGAPWVRVLEKTASTMNVRVRDVKRHKAKHPFYLRASDQEVESYKAEVPGESRTIGWKHGCECNDADVVPCTVLDPFAGAGTTGLVALRLGRSFIGIELNPKYIEMAQRRIINVRR